MHDYAKVKPMLQAEVQRLKAQGMKVQDAQRQAAKTVQAQLQGKKAG
jgi:hypothetical protein